MDRSKYPKIKLSENPSEFIEEDNIQAFAQNGWVYFDIFGGCYGLPKNGKLSHYLLYTRLRKSGYFEAATTPGLWRHT